MKRRLAVLMSICLVSMFVFSGCAAGPDNNNGNITNKPTTTTGDITKPVTTGTGTTNGTGTGTTNGTGTGTNQ